MQRLSVAEAAKVLGISQQAVHGRIKRETIEHDTGEDGKIYVYVEDNGVEQGVVNSVVNDYITSLKSEIESLKADKEVWQEEARRKDTIIMALTNRIPELEASPETPSEATEAPVKDSDSESKGVVPPETHKRSWWRRIFTS
jgi:predicted transcriptional regulator